MSGEHFLICRPMSTNIISKIGMNCKKLQLMSSGPPELELNAYDYESLLLLRAQ